jgi:thiosulfate/3-mercaptopyruvate sulfurtransferase
MNTLISVDDLLALQRAATPLVLLDCGFELADPQAGERAYDAGHLPGAHYAHLERDLSGPKQAPDGTFRGRHPLPSRADFAATVACWGVGPETPVVAYDAHGGSYAARAWWLLRWLGHERVVVLDGGVQAWRDRGGTLTSERPAAVRAEPYPAADTSMPTIDAATLLARLGRVRLLDARARERFRGEVEPLDAAAGHIPGARNRCFKDNLQPDGRFKSAEQLRAELAPLIAGHDAGTVVQQCGSGVTACHNLLALAHAGFGDSVLYPGSWSEWSSDPARPIAIGA